MEKIDLPAMFSDVGVLGLALGVISFIVALPSALVGIRQRAESRKRHQVRRVFCDWLERVGAQIDNGSDEIMHGVVITVNNRRVGKDEEELQVRVRSDKKRILQHGTYTWEYDDVYERLKTTAGQRWTYDANDEWSFNNKVSVTFSEQNNLWMIGDWDEHGLGGKETTRLHRSASRVLAWARRNCGIPVHSRGKKTPKRLRRSIYVWTEETRGHHLMSAIGDDFHEATGVKLKFKLFKNTEQLQRRVNALSGRSRFRFALSLQ